MYRNTVSGKINFGYNWTHDMKLTKVSSWLKSWFRLKASVEILWLGLSSHVPFHHFYLQLMRWFFSEKRTFKHRTTRTFSTQMYKLITKWRLRENIHNLLLFLNRQNPNWLILDCRSEKTPSEMWLLAKLCTELYLGRYICPPLLKELFCSESYLPNVPCSWHT